MRVPALAALFLIGCSAAQEAIPHCPGPLPNWLTTQTARPFHHIVINRVTVGRTGELKWNGVPVSLDQLRRYLGIVREMHPRPFTVLEADGQADCDWLQTVREAIARSLPCDEGACGEGRGWDWDL